MALRHDKVPWHAPLSRIWQGQLELQAHLPCKVMGDSSVRPHGNAGGTWHSPKWRDSDRRGFLERVAFKLRTR